MRGREELQGTAFYAINVEALIRSDHPLRPIKQMVDLELLEMSRSFSGAYGGDQVLTRNQLDQTNVVLSGLPADCFGATVTTKILAPSDHARAFTENDLAFHQSSTESLIDGSRVVSVSDLASGNVLYITLNTFGFNSGTGPPPAPTGLHRTDVDGGAP